MVLNDYISLAANSRCRIVDWADSPWFRGRETSITCRLTGKDSSQRYRHHWHIADMKGSDVLKVGSSFDAFGHFTQGTYVYRRNIICRLRVRPFMRWSWVPIGFYHCYGARLWRTILSITVENMTCALYVGKKLPVISSGDEDGDVSDEDEAAEIEVDLSKNLGVSIKLDQHSDFVPVKRYISASWGFFVGKDGMTYRSGR